MYQEPYAFVFGLVYEDNNDNGQWDPFDDGAPERESLGGVSYEVFNADTDNLLGTGQTFANGAYSFNAGDGTYDIVFDVANLGEFMLEDVVVNGLNVDAGSVRVPEPGSIVLVVLGALMMVCMQISRREQRP